MCQMIFADYDYSAMQPMTFKLNKWDNSTTLADTLRRRATIAALGLRAGVLRVPIKAVPTPAAVQRLNNVWMAQVAAADARRAEALARQKAEKQVAKQQSSAAEAAACAARAEAEAAASRVFSPENADAARRAVLAEAARMRKAVLVVLVTRVRGGGDVIPTDESIVPGRTGSPRPPT